MTSWENIDPALFEAKDYELQAATLPVVAPQAPEGYVPEVLPSSGKKLEVTIHKDHAYPILDSLLAAYANNESPYNLDRAATARSTAHA